MTSFFHRSHSSISIGSADHFWSKCLRWAVLYSRCFGISLKSAAPRTTREPENCCGQCEIRNDGFCGISCWFPRLRISFSAWKRQYVEICNIEMMWLGLIFSWITAVRFGKRQLGLTIISSAIESRMHRHVFYLWIPISIALASRWSRHVNKDMTRCIQWSFVL